MCVARREGARKLAIYGGHEDGRGAHGEARGGRFVGNLLTPPSLAKHTHSLPTETLHPLKCGNSCTFTQQTRAYSFYAFYTCIIKPIRYIDDTHTNITKWTRIWTAGHPQNLHFWEKQCVLVQLVSKSESLLLRNAPLSSTHSQPDVLLLCI